MNRYMVYFDVVVDVSDEEDGRDAAFKAARLLQEYGLYDLIDVANVVKIEVVEDK